ncbi:saccharopine dehydrogenase NADP-binding domain-containing protein [Candidatus Micrarchaeota archaeon]|nr:saccharopine dehydrogenase NADP-binding domain-containing protein [Candidatus Micrarchaeota archaeon]
MKFVVLGGTGMMGRIVVKDLFEMSKGSEIIIASNDKEKARSMAEGYKSSRVTGFGINVKEINATSRLLEGSDVALNCVQYYFNLDVMKAALKARTNYLDLGGLFYVTREQLRLHRQFLRNNLIAILGVGSTPGITNVLARYGASMLDEVYEMHVKVGSRDYSRVTNPSSFMVPYSMETILDEFTKEPIVYTKGRIRKVKPLSGLEVVNFPKPVNEVTGFYTLHSELATFPSSFRNRGLKEASFRVAFAHDFVEKIKFLVSAGLASSEPVEVGDVRIVPRKVLVKVINELPKPIIKRLEDYEFLRVDMKGRKKGKKVRMFVDCLARAKPEWNAAAGDMDTGTPPSIVAQMIADNKIQEKGVLPPELCIEPLSFFKELEKRGMKVSIRYQK